MTHRILIAGIGNIFHGDDAFGVEVARRLMQEALPEPVDVADFGIRSYDLAFALMEGYEAAVLVDAARQGEPPGTLYLFEPDVDALAAQEDEVVGGHSMSPVRVLQMVQRMGGQPGRLYLLGCEPATLEAPDGRLGLSEPVAAAVPRAINMIGNLLDALLREDETVEPGRPKAHHT